MSKKRFVTVFLFSLSTSILFSQDSRGLFQHYSDTISLLSTKVVKLESDSEKIAASDQLTSCLKLFLNTEGSFDHSLKEIEFMKIQTSSDKKLRLYNWAVLMSDGSYVYHGFIQYKLSKKETVFHQLIDKSEEIDKPESKTLNPTNWYGALYNDIIYIKKGGKKYYTFIGWDGNDLITNKRVIDVITFSRKGIPQIGAGIFMTKKGFKRRVIFEYAQKTSMSVQYYRESKAIVFDHLAPADPKGTPSSSLKGMYEFYGPDGTYDAFVFEKGKWRLKENWDARNPSKGEPKKKFNQPGNQQPPR